MRANASPILMPILTHDAVTLLPGDHLVILNDELAVVEDVRLR